MHIKCGVEVRSDGTIHVSLRSGEYWWWFPPVAEGGSGHWKFWAADSFKEARTPPPPEVLTFLKYLLPPSAAHVCPQPLL